MIPHIPVLLRECVDGLDIKPDGVYVDGTCGYGGHSEEILKRLKGGRLIAIDRDPDAVGYTGERLSRCGGSFSVADANFRDISGILDEQGVDLADGMLFDLGASSPQFDEGSRGFSYSRDAKLDMRMDKRQDFTAHEAVNTWPEERLREVFREYGEERHAGLIARAIVRKRAAAPIETTFDLNEVIFSAIPAAARREAQHPSKRVFQSLRVAVNDELGAIRDMLSSAPGRLRPGGRICVISFQSHEDRAIKTAFASLAKGCDCPKSLPVCVCGKVPQLRLTPKRPIYPGAEELQGNPRARSAKLRVAEKLANK